MVALVPGVAPRDHRRAYAVLALVSAMLVLSTVSPGRAEPPPQLVDCRTRPNRTCPRAMTVESARGLALGTGVRASSMSTSALAYSPAGLALGGLYHIEGNVDYVGFGDTVALGGMVVDSSTSRVGAGVSLRGFLGGADGFDGLDGRLGLAFPLSDAILIGVAGRYINLSTHASPSKQLARGFTMDASVRLIPTENIEIDFTALNFIDRDSIYTPFTLSGGLALSFAPGLRFGADVLADMTTFETPQFSIGGGLEYVAASVVPLRIGYAADLARTIHMITAGIGYTDQHVGLDFGLQQEVYHGHDTRLIGAIRYYLQ